MRDNPTFIVSSDQHIGTKLYNFPELENDNKELFIKLIDLCIELQTDYLICVGDLFDINKPSSALVTFVREQLDRLKANSITIPIAIAGDHDKPIDDSTWQKLAGFTDINKSHPAFVGVDYDDNPDHVIELLNRELNSRPKNTVNHIFLHQQIPELWPFCDEKKQVSLKAIDMSNHCESLECIFLGDIHIRREMRYFDIPCNKHLFVGYCGSLGVTASDETKKPGIYYWDGKSLQLIDYTLIRKFVNVAVTKESIGVLTPELFEKYRAEKNRPVFICRVDRDVESTESLHFLYDLGLVKFSKVKVGTDEQEEMVNIRSELKTIDRIAAVLKPLANKTEFPDIVYDAAYELLTSDDPKSVLDKLKKEQYDK